eukprot:513248_1
MSTFYKITSALHAVVIYLSILMFVVQSADPNCEQGVQSANSCCLSSCGTCGGDRCDQRGGASNCCDGAISRSDKFTMHLRHRPPTDLPTKASNEPTKSPTFYPSTNEPTSSPTSIPTLYPSNKPTQTPSHDPTNTPTLTPTLTPTNTPSLSPTNIPTIATLDEKTSEAYEPIGITTESKDWTTRIILIVIGVACIAILIVMICCVYEKLLKYNQSIDSLAEVPTNDLIANDIVAIVHEESADVQCVGSKGDDDHVTAGECNDVDAGEGGNASHGTQTEGRESIDHDFVNA